MRALDPRVLMAAALMMLSGCARPGPPLPPSLETPKPVTDLRATRKGDKVYLRWTVPTLTTDGQSVRNLGRTRICRSYDAEMKRCGTVVSEVSTPLPQESGKKEKTAAQKVEGSYVDTLPDEAQSAGSGILYAVSVANSDGRDAGLSNLAPAPSGVTLPPPGDFQARASAEGITLSWSAVAPPASLGTHFVYRIYRQQEGSKQDVVAGEVPVEASASEFVDRNFEWEKTYFYRADVVTITPQEGKPDLQVEGEDSAAVKIFADDVFPPGVPSGLQAVFSGVGQQPFIDLLWAPGTEADLAGYNVYRREEGGQAVKLNKEAVKTPAYRDSAVQSGKTYFYAVTAVDVRGNESGRSEEASEQVP